MRGNPDNLRQAAARKSAAAQTRAEQGLRDMIRRNEPITFRGLAQTAGFSELKMIMDPRGVVASSQRFARRQ